MRMMSANSRWQAARVMLRQETLLFDPKNKSTRHEDLQFS
jgi:hypothetical protein